MATMAAMVNCSAKGLAALAPSTALKTAVTARGIAMAPLKLGRGRTAGVRCESKPEGTPSSPLATPATPTPVVSTPTPSVKKTTVMDVFSFGGSGPETINGRLAMLGFVAALAVEFATGAPLSRQLADNGSLSWFVFTVSLFSAASLVPLFQGITPVSKSGGFFTSKAEMWNGRAAMLGLVALAITEYVQGSPLV